MQRHIIKTLLIFTLLSTGSFAGWEESSQNWSKEEADRTKEEENKDYSIGNFLTENRNGSSDGRSSTLNNISSALSVVQDLGIAGDYGGLVGDAQSMISLVNGDIVSTILNAAGKDFLTGEQSSLLNICYEKSIYQNSNSTTPSIIIDPCSQIKTDRNLEVCSRLPEIAGYKKKSLDVIQKTADKFQSICGSWKKAETVEEETTIQDKLFKNDASKSITSTTKINENTNVIEKVKRTDVANLNKMSEFEYYRTMKDKNGEPILDKDGNEKKERIQPLLGIELQDTYEKRDAYRYLKSALEKKAAEGASLEELEITKQRLLANARNANVAYKTEHQYNLAREEAISNLNFRENSIFDTSDAISSFKSSVIKKENEIDDVSQRASSIKAEKDNVVLQYKKTLDEWLKVKEAYYFKYEKRGIDTPTAYYVDSVTKNLLGNERAIRRAALMTQIDREMNRDAQYISSLRMQTNQLLKDFERKLDIVTIANRKFDLEEAMKSVGLTEEGNSSSSSSN